MTLSKQQKAKLRKILGVVGSHYPIRVVPDSDSPPSIAGKRWHYTTITGRPVRHPTAYARKGWSSLVYHSSTRRIEVGSDFVTYLATLA